MKKIRIFLGFACLSVAFACVAFTKENAKFTDPEYYLTTTNQCVQLPIPTNCSTDGLIQCTVSPSATQVNRPVYDAKDAAGNCITPLFHN